MAGHGSVLPQPSQRAVGVAVRSAEPSRPPPAPSYRSDWPAAVAPRGSAAPDPIDWASIYDDRAGWAADRALSPPRSRRLGGIINFRTDPYER